VILFNKKKKELSDINYLQLTPDRLFDHVIEENGKVSVLIPRFTNKILIKTLSPMLKSPFVKTKFDEFGSQVWLEIDGKKKVLDISTNLKQKFGERIEPVEERLTKFLTQLYNYKFVSFNEIKK
jgi:transcriptional regulator of heat shock response